MTALNINNVCLTPVYLPGKSALWLGFLIVLPRQHLHVVLPIYWNQTDPEH